MARFRDARYQPARSSGRRARPRWPALEEHRADLPGLVIQPEPRRTYPERPGGGPPGGYVGEVSRAGPRRATASPGARLGVLVGRAGLEQEYDVRLRGTPGLRYIEVDARGRLVREEGAAPPLPPVPGKPLQTTIDLPLQRFIDSIWPRAGRAGRDDRGDTDAARSGPSTPRPPTIPTSSSAGISSKEWNALNEDPALPLLNRAVQVRYPPASPFKLAMAAMALRRGLVDLRTQDAGALPGRTAVRQPVLQVLEARGPRLPRSRGGDRPELRRLLLPAGAQARTERDPAGRRAAGLPGPQRDRHPERDQPDLPANRPPTTTGCTGRADWSSAVVLNLSIGQGENTQTLSNMVRFYEALASGGKAPTPYVVRPRPDQARDLGLTPDQLDGDPAGPDRGGGARHRGGAPNADLPWPERPGPRRIRTARTTAGSSGSRRRTSPRSSWAASWNSPSTAPSSLPTSSGRSVATCWAGADRSSANVTLVIPTIPPARRPVKPDSVSRSIPGGDATSPPPPATPIQ